MPIFIIKKTGLIGSYCGWDFESLRILVIFEMLDLGVNILTENSANAPTDNEHQPKFFNATDAKETQRSLSAPFQKSL